MQISFNVLKSVDKSISPPGGWLSEQDSLTFLQAHHHESDAAFTQGFMRRTVTPLSRQCVWRKWSESCPGSYSLGRGEFTHRLYNIGWKLHLPQLLVFALWFCDLCLAPRPGIVSNDAFSCEALTPSTRNCSKQHLFLREICSRYFSREEMRQIITDHQMITHPACEGWFVQQYRGDLKVSLEQSTEKLVRFLL